MAFSCSNFFGTECTLMNPPAPLVPSFYSKHPTDVDCSTIQQSTNSTILDENHSRLGIIPIQHTTQTWHTICIRFLHYLYAIPIYSLPKYVPRHVPLCPLYTPMLPGIRYITLHSVTFSYLFSALPCAILQPSKTQIEVVHTMISGHPAKYLKELYLSGLISYTELYDMVESYGWELNRSPNGILRIKGKDNNARWVVTIR